MAFDQHERRHVVQHAAQTAHEAIAADRRIMMHRHGARQRSVVVHMHVAAQQRAVGQHDVAAQSAIMRHVAASHEIIVAAHRRDAVFLFGGPVDRHPFADHVVIADNDLSVAAAVAQILRFAANDHAGAEVIIFAQRDVPHQCDMIVEPRSASDPHMGADDAEGPDLHIDVDFRVGMNRHIVGDVSGHDNRSAVRGSPCFVYLSAATQILDELFLIDHRPHQVAIEPVTTAMRYDVTHQVAAS